MSTLEIVNTINNLLTQTENGYHFSDEDIKQAEIALNIAEQVLAKAKRS